MPDITKMDSFDLNLISDVLNLQNDLKIFEMSSEMLSLNINPGDRETLEALRKESFNRIKEKYLKE